MHKSQKQKKKLIRIKITPRIFLLKIVKNPKIIKISNKSIYNELLKMQQLIFGEVSIWSIKFPLI